MRPAGRCLRPAAARAGGCLCRVRYHLAQRHGSTVPTAARAPAAAANGVAEGLADRISAGIRYRQGMRAVRSDVRE